MEWSKQIRTLFSLWILGICTSVSGASFHRGEQVELVKPVPLLRDGQFVRDGVPGEKFTVMLSDPQKHLVTVTTRDANGRECSVVLNDELVRTVQATQASPLGNKPIGIAARLDAKARIAALEMNDGKRDGEDAVLKGLRWLVQTQNADGSWGDRPPMNAGMTGLSVLSLLGHGELPVSPEFGPSLQKAIDWIVTNGEKNGGHLCSFPNFYGRNVEMHGIQTAALAEYYRLSKDERVVNLLKLAVGYMLEGQGADGGWQYGYEKTKSEAPITTLHIEALDNVRQSGLRIEGVDAALTKASTRLRDLQGRDGGFGISGGSSDYDATGIAILGLYLCSHRKDEMTRLGVEYLMKHTKGTFAANTRVQAMSIHYQDEQADLYTWYYNTRSCFIGGGAAWKSWNRLFQPELVKNQSPDGTWPPHKGGVDFFGGHTLFQAGPRLESAATQNGALFRTNLCILMLEVYYRDLAELN